MASKKKIHRSADEQLSPLPANPATINNRQIFSNIRLHQWHTNEEIFNILHYFSTHETSLLANQAVHRPCNGSVLIFNRHTVKNFKKACYLTTFKLLIQAYDNQRP
jgi:hypothetical protein